MSPPYGIPRQIPILLTKADKHIILYLISYILYLRSSFVYIVSKKGGKNKGFFFFLKEIVIDFAGGVC